MQHRRKPHVVGRRRLVAVVPEAPEPIRARRRVWTDLARIFSTIFNPFLTAFALFVIEAQALAKDVTTFWSLVFLSTFFTSVGPMLYVFWLYATSRITDLDMSLRHERQAVFTVFVIFYLMGAITLALIRAPALLVATMAGYTTSSLAVQVITRRWKISTHAIGITAPLVALCVLYGKEPLPFTVLIPIVGWARVYLRAHTVGQVIAGSSLGCLSVLLFLHLFRIV